MTWLFGELDIDLNLTPEQIYDKVSEISEHCGYMSEMKIRGSIKTLEIHGADLEQITMTWKDNKLQTCIKKQFTDMTGELTLVSEENLVG